MYANLRKVGGFTQISADFSRFRRYSPILSAKSAVICENLRELGDTPNFNCTIPYKTLLLQNIMNNYIS